MGRRETKSTLDKQARNGAVTHASLATPRSILPVLTKYSYSRAALLALFDLLDLLTPSLLAQTSPIQQAACWLGADSDSHRVRRHWDAWVPIEALHTTARLVCVDPVRDIGDVILIYVCIQFEVTGTGKRNAHPASAAGPGPCRRGWAPPNGLGHR